MKKHVLSFLVLVTSALSADAFAQSLVCPSVSSNTGFTGATLQTDCSTTNTTTCTSKAGVTFDATNNVLRLPGAAGNFQSPPNAAVEARVFFAAPGDFDKDGWTDFVAADEFDHMWVMRNQTITCGTGACSTASPPVAQTIASTWWDTLSNTRQAAFRQPSGSTTTYNPVTSFTCGTTGVTFSSGTSSKCGGSTTIVTYSNSTKKITCSSGGLSQTCSGAGGQTGLTCSGKAITCAAAGTTTTTDIINLKEPAATSGQRYTPMASGDFDGDGWTDFLEVSNMYIPSNTYPVHATAARLFLNTKNCHLTTETANPKPCGIGSLCTGQPTNGACSGGSVTSGAAYAETNLSCLTTTNCPYYMPTFASYDLLTGSAITAVGDTDVNADSGTGAAPTNNKPGDFGNIDHPVSNVVVLDFDGDGDLDLLFGHGPGAPPGTLASANSSASGGATSYVSIDVWRNDCANGAWWNATTHSCVGHIPVFSHATPPKTCTGTGCAKCDGTSCNGTDILIPSTAHNNSTLAPSDNLKFDYSNHETPGFAYTDIDKDGDYDLVLGSPGCCSGTTNDQQYRLRIFKGTSNSPTVHTLDTSNPISLSTSNTQHPGFTGALTAVFAYDFSGDGYADIITGQDGYSYSSTLGGITRYWKHTGNPTNPYGLGWPSCSSGPASCANCGVACNPDATTAISENCGSTTCTATFSPPKFPDFDSGFMLDYDNDPNHTLDMVFTNGNISNEFYIFPNRATNSTVAACGTVSSGTLAQPSDESTVSGACLTPTASFPNNTSSIKYYMTNEDPANYILACTQTQTSTPSSCCVSFTNITGKTIRWQAVMDSNNSDDATANPCTATGTASPTLSSVTANYTFSTAAQHYRAGVVISDGVTYVGSFRQPGNRGSFYALSAGDGTRYYDAADKIDNQTNRWVYTASGIGTAISRVDFSATSATAGNLTSMLGSSASAIVTWVMSRRFGLGSTLSTLGAVMDSTPAVLTPPYRPNWYTYLPASDKLLYDTFATTYTNRPTLALVASMDGMLHAIISPSTSITTDPNAGTEAWAFIPPNVGASMSSDYTTSCPSGTCSTSTLNITSFPDGSPALLDYKKADNTIATAALVGDGAGGKSLSALDVTSTITVSGSGSSATYARTGPTPMWSQLPGDSGAGKAMSKPGVARVRLTGVEKYIVVAATGIDSADASKGKVVAGYNLETGALLWKFETSCAVTSDVTIFETDDSGETGAPTIDGFADRAVFADDCGNVYKINPAQDLSGGWMGNVGFGATSIGTSNGVARYSLFQTNSAAALDVGGERPIVGAIAAKAGSDGDVILFFGTGGIESYDETKQNAFFAIYAKNGAIRGTSPGYAEGKILGACNSATPRQCEKFYGGVVLSTDSVILQTTRDAVITGVPNSCDFGQSKVYFRNLNTLAQTDLVDTIGGQPIAASSSPLYGDANAIYFATVSGKINRIGSPRATTAGQDTSGGNMHQMSGGAGATTYDSPFTLMGWRVVL